jgi:hypothetical protein
LVHLYQYLGSFTITPPVRVVLVMSFHGYRLSNGEEPEPLLAAGEGSANCAEPSVRLPLVEPLLVQSHSTP